MTDSSVIDIAVQSILLATKLAAPILGVSLAIGLFVGLIQSATQIQEQTLTFVPKLAGVALVLVRRRPLDARRRSIGSPTGCSTMIPHLIDLVAPNDDRSPFDPVVLTAFALALVRAAAWLFVSPPFNTRMIPTVGEGRDRGLARAGGRAAHRRTRHPARHRAASSARSSRKRSSGFTLGLFTVLLVNALQAAGSLVDLFAGFSLAAIYDPINHSQVAIFGRFYELLAITLLFTTNAYLILVNGWFRSFEVVPAQRARDRRHRRHAHQEPRAVPHRRDRGRGAGARLPVPRRGHARPALARRAELNVFSLAFPLRVVVALIVVALAIPLISPALGNLVRDAVAPLGGLSDGAPMAGGDTGDKTEKPTPKRLKEAREKGQIAKTPDLSAWVGDARDDRAAPDDVQRGGDRAPRHARADGRAIAHPDAATRDAVRGRARCGRRSTVVAPMLIG